jgi:hypothetical protein
VGKSFVKKVKEEYNHQSPGSAHAQPPHFPLAFPQKLRQLYYNKPTFSGWPLCRLLLGSLAQPITSPPNSRQCLRTGLLNAAASSIARANQTKKNSAFFCSAAAAAAMLTGDVGICQFNGPNAKYVVALRHDLAHAMGVV